MSDKSDAAGEPKVIWLQDVLDETFGAGTTTVICPITDAFVAHHGALGGFGPQACQARFVQIQDAGGDYDFSDPSRVIGVDGTRTISGHGDISSPSTWWLSYRLASAHGRPA
jgi:hypothetical protein